MLHIMQANQDPSRSFRNQQRDDQNRYDQKRDDWNWYDCSNSRDRNRSQDRFRRNDSHDRYKSDRSERRDNSRDRYQRDDSQEQYDKRDKIDKCTFCNKNNHDISDCFKLKKLINKEIEQKEQYSDDHKETSKQSEIDYLLNGSHYGSTK